jgi:hypothetical protein
MSKPSTIRIDIKDIPKNADEILISFDAESNAPTINTSLKTCIDGTPYVSVDYHDNDKGDINNRDIKHSVNNSDNEEKEENPPYGIVVRSNVRKDKYLESLEGIHKKSHHDFVAQASQISPNESLRTLGTISHRKLEEVNLPPKKTRTKVLVLGVSDINTDNIQQYIKYEREYHTPYKIFENICAKNHKVPIVQTLTEICWSLNMSSASDTQLAVLDDLGGPIKEYYDLNGLSPYDIQHVLKNKNCDQNLIVVANDTVITWRVLKSLHFDYIMVCGDTSTYVRRELFKYIIDQMYIEEGNTTTIPHPEYFDAALQYHLKSGKKLCIRSGVGKNYFSEYMHWYEF